MAVERVWHVSIMVSTALIQFFRCLLTTSSRINLAGETTEAPAEGADGPLSPPLNEPGHTGSVDTSTNTQATELSNLRNAPASERIAALRELAAQQPPAAPTDIAEQSRRARITNRLRDRFRIRTQPTDNVVVPRRGSTHPRNDSVLSPGGSLGISAMPLPVYDDPARNNADGRTGSGA
jgi:hypothetical protein